MNESDQRTHIGRRDVGVAHQTYVIAEAGVNHNGSEACAMRMVDAASEAGADAVKFQMFTADALATQSVAPAAYQRDRTYSATQREMLRALELTNESFARIARRCEESGVDFLATPFSVRDVDRAVEAGSVAIKIASTDLVDVALMARAAHVGLPMILSTGAADEDEIADAVERIEAWGGRDRLILMHCVSAYPTPINNANLLAIPTLRERFRRPVGYSDHTTSTTTGALAVAMGACVLEKHFTLNVEAVGPDHAMSLEPDRLREYVERAREADVAMGTGRLDHQDVERDVRDIGRKVLVAACDIEPGAIIAPDMLTTKRAGKGLAPSSASKIVGMRARVTIQSDTAITVEQVW